VSVALTGQEIKVEPKHYELDAESFSVGVNFQPIGTVAEQRIADGQGWSVDYRPVGGGSSLSEMAADGSYQAELPQPGPGHLK
jgi:hypothetical protein